LLCLIIKVLCRSSATFYILHHSRFFVNTFFKLFWKTFLLFFDDFCHQRELSYLTTEALLCQHLFQTFLKNF